MTRCDTRDEGRPQSLRDLLADLYHRLAELLESSTPGLCLEVA